MTGSLLISEEESYEKRNTNSKVLNTTEEISELGRKNGKVLNATKEKSEEDRSKLKNSKVNVTEKLIAQTFPQKNSVGTDYSYKHEVVWKNAVAFLILHVFAIYGVFLVFTGTSINFYTIVWCLLFVNYFAGEGITVGAHRYYTHKTFKAKPVLRAILLVGQTLAGQNSMYVWCRDHRLHHRYSDTDADPHNAQRGFFFSHVGWLLTKKHPFVKEYGRNIDLSDLEADWMVMFQRKYYFPLYIILVVLFYFTVPMYCFGETLKNCFFSCYTLCYVYQLNATWLVNSAAHIYGTRPYDSHVYSSSRSGRKRGWHNYHHAFPWDYKAAELTMHFNLSATLIRFLEHIGLAWDLKTASPELVEKRIFRTGDGTHYQFGSDEARAAVTAVGIVHPFNPTYTTVTKTRSHIPM